MFCIFVNRIFTALYLIVCICLFFGIRDMPIKFLNPISISTALDIEHIACPACPACINTTQNLKDATMQHTIVIYSIYTCTVDDDFTTKKSSKRTLILAITI